MNHRANDPFSIEAPSLISSGERHYAVGPSDDADLPIRPKCLYIQTTGIIVIRDIGGVDVSYAVAAGQVFPFRGVRVMDTGTTASSVAWY